MTFTSYLYEDDETLLYIPHEVLLFTPSGDISCTALAVFNHHYDVPHVYSGKCYLYSLVYRVP